MDNLPPIVGATTPSRPAEFAALPRQLLDRGLWREGRTGPASAGKRTLNFPDLMIAANRMGSDSNKRGARSAYTSPGPCCRGSPKHPFGQPRSKAALGKVSAAPRVVF